MIATGINVPTQSPHYKVYEDLTRNHMFAPITNQPDEIMRLTLADMQMQNQFSFWQINFPTASPHMIMIGFFKCIPEAHGQQEIVSADNT